MGRKKHKVFRSNQERLQFLDNMKIISSEKIGYDLYEKLLMEGRLPRFRALVKLCSKRGLSIKDTVEEIKKAFPGYITNRTFNIDVFISMCRNHSDIASCWGYGDLGDEVTNQMIKDKATEIALSSDDIQVIKIYNEMYNREFSGTASDDEKEDNTTHINIYNER